MAKSLVWTEGAEQDLDDAIGYLEEREVGRGMVLLAEVTRVVSRILELPRVSPECEPGMRRAFIKSFSYHLFYTLTDDDSVVVHALIHTAADPGGWPNP